MCCWFMKHARVMPVFAAAMMPDRMGTAFETMIGIFILAALSTMSAGCRPELTIREFAKFIFAKTPIPMTLSIVLWRPTSSARPVNRSFSNNAATWTPLVDWYNGPSLSF